MFKKICGLVEMGSQNKPGWTQTMNAVSVEFPFKEWDLKKNDKISLPGQNRQNSTKLKVCFWGKNVPEIWTPNTLKEARRVMTTYIFNS